MSANSEANYRLAHALARMGLGLNIALHGLVRLPQLTKFAEGMQQQFANTILPPTLVLGTGFGLPVAESLLGGLILLGLFLRPALIGGTLVMFVLIFGSCLQQNWDVVGLQMNYIAYYAGLLATLRWSGWSLDNWRRQQAAETSVSS